MHKCQSASTVHIQIGKAIKQARMQVQSLLGAAHDSEIVFNSCGTESGANAILSTLNTTPKRKWPASSPPYRR
jgi:cysteine desulfurase